MSSHRFPPPRPRSRRSSYLAGLLLGGFSAIACGPAPAPLSSEGEPLFSAEHTPDPLVEQRRLEAPPSRGANRFLTGWWPASSSGGGSPTLLALAGGSKLEVVQLEARHRTLRLDFERAPEGLVAVLGHRGTELDRAPVAELVRLGLPADLPLGRVTLDLHFETLEGQPLQSGESDVADPVVRAASVTPVLPTATVDWDEERVVQAGPSRLDLVRRVEGPIRLLGRFEPPSEPEPDQRFHLELEGEDGSVERLLSFEGASPGTDFGARLLGHGTASSFELSLGERQGFVRLRLVADGEGPAATWRGLRWVSSQPRDDSEPTATEASKPGVFPRLVVVYVMDALRADAVGHLGGPEGITPHLDRLASEGVTFVDHHAVAPNTLPSTLALFTGRTVRHARQLGRLAEDGPATLAEHFRQAGYTTALFSGNRYVGPSFGTDRGFEHVTVEGFTEDGPYNDNAEVLHRAMLEWIIGRDPEERLFLYVHVVNPHNPFAPPDGLATPYLSAEARTSRLDGSTPTLLDLRQRRRVAGPADEERLRGLYLGSQAYVDREIGKLLAALGERFGPEEQLLAFTSDHGEELFEHGGILHGYTLYQEMMRIPLILWSPGRLSPGRMTALSDTLDFRATLLALCGLAPEPSTEGRSLVHRLGSPPHVGGEGAGEALLFASAASVKGGLYSIRSRHWKVVWAPRIGGTWGMGQRLGRSWAPEYVFDLRDDPREQDNLAGIGELEVAWLRSRLLAWIDARVETATEEVEIDEETRRQLEALGYMQ